MIEHIAIFTSDLEKVKNFYLHYFEGSASEKYYNSKTGFSSYFISFRTGARIELMHREDMDSPQSNGLGFHHFAFTFKNEDEVVLMTKRFSDDGLPIVSAPRTTGDGYFESVIKDPEGNLIELTCPRK
jgi:lactoylglutathione lyase